MKKLLNTLYISTPNYYLSLDGEAVKISENKETVGLFPLLNFESIVTHGYTGVSPALLATCMEKGIPICFMSRNGRFIGRVSGENRGNVLLRKEQYRISDDVDRALPIARHCILAKVHNQKWILERVIRDHPLQVNVEKLRNVSRQMSESYESVRNADNLDSLRGIEGETSRRYYSCFDELILQQKLDFTFRHRSRRPPLDNINAVLSYLYSLLAHDVASALESVGLDPYVGFLHQDRPGRMSLALDLMEEFRSIIVDRTVLTSINRLEISSGHFNRREDGAVMLNDTGRKKIITVWQNRKQDQITHPYLKEKISWGLVPYCQALLLARSIRGDIDCYPSFLYRI